MAFFTYYWVKLNTSPKLRLYSICYLCRDYFNEPPKNRDEEILKYYNTFFNAFFTKERILKLKKRYPGTIYSNIIKKNHFGKNPEYISLDKSVLYPDFGPTKIDPK